MPTKAQSTAPATLKAFYAKITGDATTHQRTIDAHFRKLDTRRQAIIRARLEGKSLQEIGNQHGGINGATVRETMLRGIERIRKAIAGEPRFNHVGRRRTPAEETAE